MAERCHWIMRGPCHCVLGATFADGKTAAEAADFLFGDDHHKPGVSMELVTRTVFERDIRATFLKHTCGGGARRPDPVDAQWATAPRETRDDIDEWERWT